MQLPLNIDWQQILLHALNLVILVGGLYALLFKPVKKFMDQRAENYQKMKADAEDAKTQAEAFKAELNERMKHADEETQAYRQEAMPRWKKKRRGAGFRSESGAEDRERRHGKGRQRRKADRAERPERDRPSERGSDPETDGLQTVRRVRSVP